MPLSVVIFLSENAPVYKSLTNIMAPFGGIPTSPFAMLWRLYDENVYWLL